MHCILEEPKATMLSKIHSANPYSLSSITLGFDLDLLRKSLETLISIWKVEFIAESNSSAVASTGLFLKFHRDCINIYNISRKFLELS
jgi:hypothetical protein